MVEAHRRLDAGVRTDVVDAEYLVAGIVREVTDGDLLGRREVQDSTGAERAILATCATS